MIERILNGWKKTALHKRLSSNTTKGKKKNFLFPSIQIQSSPWVILIRALYTRLTFIGYSLNLTNDSIRYFISMNIIRLKWYIWPRYVIKIFFVFLKWHNEDWERPMLIVLSYIIRQEQSKHLRNKFGSTSFALKVV